MKKSIISGVLALTVFFGVSQTIATPVAHAQNISIQQLIQLFISLGIIPSDKVAMVEAAFGMTNTTGTTSTTVSPTTTTSSTTQTTTNNNIGSFTANPISGSVPLQVTFSTSGKYNAWETFNYGDGTNISMGTPFSLNDMSCNAGGPIYTVCRGTHTYSAPGTYTATLYDSQGNQLGAVTVTVTTTQTTVGGLNATSPGTIVESVHPGDQRSTLITFGLQAINSPITIQRVQVDIGSSGDFYTKYFKNLYLTDQNGNVLAQISLNSNTVTLGSAGGNLSSGPSTEYYVTFTGFDYMIPKDNATHLFNVVGDLYGSIDLSNAPSIGASVSVSIDSQSIRGVDNIGVDQYAPLKAISNTVFVTP